MSKTIVFITRDKNSMFEKTENTKGLFSLFSRDLDDQLSSNFHSFVCSCICWITQNVDTDFELLPKVYNTFKRQFIDTNETL